MANLASPTSFNIEIRALPIPKWCAANGGGYHIRALNLLLPGPITTIRRYASTLEVCPNTLHHYLTAIKSAVIEYFGDAYLFDLRTQYAINIFFESIMPKRDRRIKVQILSEDLILKLIQESPGLKASVWIQNLYTLGRRVSDLCTLRWSDIQIQSSDLAVAQCKAKGGDIDLFHIPMWLINLNRTVFRGQEFMMENRYGEENNRKNVLKLIYAASEEVLGHKVHSHVFRHCFASHQMQKNPGRIKAIMMQGGWKDARVFLNTYGHDQITAEDFRMKPQAAPLSGKISYSPNDFGAEDFIQLRRAV